MEFVNEKIVEFEIDKEKFKYKPVTAGEENEWLNEYMVEKDGKFFQDLNKVNQCKIRNLIEVPWDKSKILNIIGIEKDWSELSKEQRWNLLSKLNPKSFSQIILKINDIDSGDLKIKKNLKAS